MRSLSKWVDNILQYVYATIDEKNYYPKHKKPKQKALTLIVSANFFSDIINITHQNTYLKFKKKNPLSADQPTWKIKKPTKSRPLKLE